MAESVTKGRAVIEELAGRFPQLYVAPAEGAQDAYRMASTRGVAPEGADLSHFITNAEDELRVVETPAGPVDVVFFKERADFETFLQIIGHKAQPDPIARTVGAITYRGLADWSKVRRAYAAYVAEGGTDWGSEFRRLAKSPDGFRAELIIISDGPYSNISASMTPYDEATWTDVSREIRLHHECAHVVCRRTMPEDILPVWDEVTADVVGLICATGHYSVDLAALFLGVDRHGYTGGRLVEYLSDEQKERVDEVSREVFAACEGISRLCTEADESHPFDFLLALKREPLIAY